MTMYDYEVGMTKYFHGKPVILRVEKMRGWIVEGEPDEEGIPDQWFAYHGELSDGPASP